MNGKTLIAAACAISLALGYIAGKAGGGPDAADTAATNPNARPERTTSRESRTHSNGESALLDSLLGGRPIGAVPPADLAALIAKLSKFEPGMDPLTATRQRYQLQLLLAKLSPADLAGIADAVDADPDSPSTSSLGSVLTALAAQDPDRAVAWLSARETNPGLLIAVIGAIARDDPHTAARLLRESTENGKLTGYRITHANYGVAQGMARLGADASLGFLDSLPGQNQGNIANNMIQYLPEGERLRFLEEIRLRSQDGRLAGVSLEHLFTDTLSSDEPAAREWFAKFPEGDEKNAMRTRAAHSMWEDGRREQAAAWMREALAAAPGKEKATLARTIAGMAHSNPEGIPTFAALLPEGEGLTAADLEAYGMSALFSGTDGLTTLASAIPDPSEKARFLADTLGANGGHRLNANDYEILSRKVAAMGFTGENADLVNNAIENAKGVSQGTGE